MNGVAANDEASILARVLGREQAALPPSIARNLVNLEFSQTDKERMHDLAVRNQDDALSDEEKQELMSFARAGTVLSILKSKARRALRGDVKRRTNA